MCLPPRPGGDAPRETQHSGLPSPHPLLQPSLSGSFCMRTCPGGERLDQQSSAEALELEIRAAMGKLMSVTQFVRALVSGVHLPSRVIPAQPAPHPQPNTAAVCFLDAAGTAHFPQGTLGFLCDSPNCKQLCVCVCVCVCLCVCVCVCLCVCAFSPLFIFLCYL